MQKIIGRGVLLLQRSGTGPGFKFGFELRSNGIQCCRLVEGADPALIPLSDALAQSPLSGAANVTGTGHLMLNDLPASPNDAFYDIQFKTGKTGDFTLQVREAGAFAHGPQYHFSGLDITFQFKNNTFSVLKEGAVRLHFNQEVFEPGSVNNGNALALNPGWNAESETLVFTAPAAQKIQMDAIGNLANIQVEIGSSYDRWNNVQGLYTFEGGLSAESDPEAIATHDISGRGAPSLFFEGLNNFKQKPNDPPYGAKWTDKGIAFNGNCLLASMEKEHNPTVGSIQVSEDFSIELWIKPNQTLQEGPAQIFSIESTPNTAPRSYCSIGQGPWTDGKHKKEASEPAGAFLNVSYGPPATAVPLLKAPYWEKPFESPANSLGDTLMHVVYSYDQAGTQRIFINGVQIAEKYDPGYYNDWLGDLRFALGNDLRKNKPWKGKVQQLAIFNRALTAEDVARHYHPALTITGDFSLDNMIPPLKDEAYPFHLSIREDAAALIATRAVNFDINPRIGFRHVHLECLKSTESKSKWSFNGIFQTRFWDDRVLLYAALDTGGARLQLTSPNPSTEPMNHSPFNAVQLTFKKDKNWELAFGKNKELAVLPLVLENAMPGSQEFRLGDPQLSLGDPVRMKGNWLDESMTFTSEGAGTARVLKGSTKFALPFYLVLPPKVDPDTGDTFGEAIELDTVMQISLDVELRKEGFLGAVKDISFKHENKKITLPDRRIYVPPVSKMALLGDLLEEVKTQDETLFGGTRKHKEDYYLKTKTNSPYIFLSASDKPEDPVISELPKIFKADYQSPADNAVFTLNQTGSTCTLTLAPGSANSAGIRAAYANLMADVETQGGLDAGGLRVLQNRIAECLPLEYGDLLYYHYGWNMFENYIDLHPGMRLRVDFQQYQFVHATEQKAANGFAGAGSIYVPIHSYTDSAGSGAQYLGFGPFLSHLLSSARGKLSSEGAGGLFDLVKTGSRKPFFRLIFPNETIPAAAPERAVTIVGADRLQDLPTTIPLAADDTGSIISFFFRDRAMIIPEIQVFVGNRELYVPVGTTLRQLLEKYAGIPAASAAKPDLAAFLGKTRPRRLLHTGPDSTPSYRFLNPGTNNMVKNLDVFDLPLIKGDKFYF
ncbi:MAG: LamG domain-containing protein [Saprospiraceae bacterium]